VHVDRSRLLAELSAAQLATGVAGMTMAVRRRHPYDFAWMHGRPENVTRDSVLMGTAFSAPIYMLVAQGVATRRSLRGAGTGSDAVLGGLGAAMIGGYLGEALVRRRLRPSGYDRVESPLIIAAIGLSGAMAALGLWRR
jgi:hypothetical protein